MPALIQRNTPFECGTNVLIRKPRRTASLGIHVKRAKARIDYFRVLQAVPYKYITFDIYLIDFIKVFLFLQHAFLLISNFQRQRRIIYIDFYLYRHY